MGFNLTAYVNKHHKLHEIINNIYFIAKHLSCMDITTGMGKTEKLKKTEN